MLFENYLPVFLSIFWYATLRLCNGLVA